MAHAQKVQLITKSMEKMIDTMRGHWHGWHESIPSCWGRCGIAVRRRKST
jgi:hypothetical protein